MKRFLGLVLTAVLVIFLLPLKGQAEGLDVPGKSALLMDMETGTVLYEKNAHERLSPASVTKVMTMLLIMEAIDDHRITWDDTVTASESAAAKGGSQVYLKVGETMTVTDMVKAIAVSSANDCACAMAEHLAGTEGAFVEQMNRRAKELGMEDTNFVNCTGLDDGADAAQHKTSAYDIALMSRELMKNHPDIKNFTTIWMDTLRNGEFGLSNTNKLIRFYQGATGLKTGFTSGAGYCLSATAERDGMSLIAVVMGCETSNQRTAACKAMLDHGFVGYAVVTPALPEQISLPVTLGKTDRVTLLPESSAGLLIHKEQKSSITTDIDLSDPPAAPVEQGQRLGTMTVRAGDRVLAEIPLVADQQVPRLTWWELTVQLLKRTAMAKD